jgi:shikimate dehydrogenase
MNYPTNVLKTIGLIGDPVSHSRSPQMHNAALAHLGIAARYEAWPTPAAELPDRIATMRTPSVLGANVTLPHKETVVPLLDALEPEARQIGAVNTIYRGKGGALVGANTDAPGLLAALAEGAGFAPDGQRVVLLGASGAARAAAFALVNAGVSHLAIANRTLARARSLVDDLRPAASGSGQPLEAPEVVALPLDQEDPAFVDAVAACTLLINATSVGWKEEETPLPGIPVTPGTLVYDMIYRRTRLLQEAEAQGARTLDGLGMLLHQGALGFARWTGHEAPIDVMRTAMGMSQS